MEEFGPSCSLCCLPSLYSESPEDPLQHWAFTATSRKGSQGDPASLQASQIQSCSPSEIFSTMQGLCSIPPWGRMCYAADNSNDSPSNALQGVSNARCHVLACSSMQGVAVLLFREGNRRILQAKLSRQPCSNGNTLIW